MRDILDKCQRFCDEFGLVGPTAQKDDFLVEVLEPAMRKTSGRKHSSGLLYNSLKEVFDVYFSVLQRRRDHLESSAGNLIVVDDGHGQGHAVGNMNVYDGNLNDGHGRGHAVGNMNEGVENDGHGGNLNDGHGRGHAVGVENDGHGGRGRGFRERRYVGHGRGRGRGGRGRGR